MLHVVTRLLREDLGQDLIEYGLLAGLIALVAVATITSLGNKLNTFYFSAIDAAVP